MERHPDDLNEPMLQPDNSRFILFPIQHKKLWEYYKKAEATARGPLTPACGHA